jgi:hypothetical protein
VREWSSRLCDFNSCSIWIWWLVHTPKAAVSLPHSEKCARLRRRPLQTLTEEFAGDFGDVLALVPGDFQLVFAGLA